MAFMKTGSPEKQNVVIGEDEKPKKENYVWSDELQDYVLVSDEDETNPAS